MPTKHVESRAFIMQQRVILVALIFGMTVFAAITLYLNSGGGGFGASPEDARLYGWVLVGLGTEAGSYTSAIEP